MNSFRITLAVLSVVVLGSHAYESQAQDPDVPMLLNYQGQLKNASGVPQNGTFSMTFKFFDAESGGIQLPSAAPWTEVQSVTVTDGVFNVLLGSATDLPDDLFDGGPTDSKGPLRYLEVVVEGETLTPRKRVGSAGYALGRGLTGSSTGGLARLEVFASSGTWIRPAGVDQVYVSVWGGGGGTDRSDTNGGIGGGGGGGYAEGFVAVSADVAVTVGKGGRGRTFGGQVQEDGGTSAFAGDSVVQATGGRASFGVSGGQGGSGSGGILNLSGEAGQNGSGVRGGDGGSTHQSPGPPGAVAELSEDGRSAQLPGAGGGGAAAIHPGNNAIGGNGAGGLVIVQW